MIVGFFVLGLLILAAAAVVLGEVRGLRAMVLRELGGMSSSLRGLHSEAALANRQRPAAVALPPVVVQRRLVAVTHDDDEVHQRKTVVTPPPPGADRESADELTTVFGEPARPPDSGSVRRSPPAAAGRSG